MCDVTVEDGYERHFLISGPSEVEYWVLLDIEFEWIWISFVSVRKTRYRISTRPSMTVRNIFAIEVSV